MDDAAELKEPAEGDGWEWAIVEIFGHRRHGGRIREEERFGSKLMRIDVPKITPEPTLLDAADGKKPDPVITWTTHYYGGAAIFSLTLTDEATVMRAAKPYEPPHRLTYQHDDDFEDGDHG